MSCGQRPGILLRMVALLLPMLLFATGCGGGSATLSSTSNPTQPTTPAAPQIPGSSFFGIHTNNSDDPWPATLIPVYSWRSLGSSIKWADLNPAPGSYDWTNLDSWLSKAEGGGQDIMFTMYGTPSWGSSRGLNCNGGGPGCIGPPDVSCAFANTDGPGICDPPADLNCDGSGPDQIFQTFVAALLNHVGVGKIKFWEMWNEPNVTSEWNGAQDCPNTPNAQYLMLARMASDMRSIVSAADSNAKFTSPPATGPGTGGAADWTQAYFASTNGAAAADIVGFHGYVQAGACPQTCPQPEDV